MFQCSFNDYPLEFISKPWWWVELYLMFTNNSIVVVFNKRYFGGGQISMFGSDFCFEAISAKQVGLCTRWVCLTQWSIGTWKSFYFRFRFCGTGRANWQKLGMSREFRKMTLWLIHYRDLQAIVSRQIAFCWNDYLDHFTFICLLRSALNFLTLFQGIFCES